MFLSNIAFPVGVVVGGLVLSLLLLGPYLTGMIAGSVLGSFAIGGAFGWVIHKVFRAPYELADAIGLLVLTCIAGYTNSSPERSVTQTLAMYAVASLVAYFLLRRFRAGAPAQPNSRRIEPELEAAEGYEQGDYDPPQAAHSYPAATPRQNPWLAAVRRLFHVLYALCLVWAVVIGVMAANAGGIRPDSALLFAAVVGVPFAIVAAAHYIALGFSRR